MDTALLKENLNNLEKEINKQIKMFVDFTGYFPDIKIEKIFKQNMAGEEQAFGYYVNAKIEI